MPWGGNETPRKSDKRRIAPLAGARTAGIDVCRPQGASHFVVALVKRGLRSLAMICRPPGWITTNYPLGWKESRRGQRPSTKNRSIHSPAETKPVAVDADVRSAVVTV